MVEIESSDFLGRAVHAPLYVRFKGRVIGPIEPDKLQLQIERGQLSRVHEVSEDGVAWVRASRYPGLFDRPSSDMVAAVEALIDEDQVEADEKSPQAAQAPAAHATASPRSQWFYAIGDGPQEGPVTFDVLQSLARSGSLNASAQVWTAGLPEWVSPESVAGLVFKGTEAAAPVASTLRVQEPAIDQEASLQTCRTLASTRPWLLFCAILAFLSAAANLFWAIVVFARAGSAGVASPAIVTAGLGLLVGSAVTGVGAGLLTAYSGRIGVLLMYKRQRNLEEVLLAAKVFWQYVGIVLIVVLTALALMLVWLAAVAGSLSIDAL